MRGSLSLKFLRRSSGLNWQRAFALSALVLSLGLSSGCAKNTSREAPVEEEKKKKPVEVGASRDPLGVRYCDLPITGTLGLSQWEARFAELFQWDVENFEDSPTICMEFYSFGTQAEGAIMIEYEDNFGIAYLPLEEANVFFGEIKRDSSKSSIEIIYNFSINGVGFLLQLKGQASGSSVINAQIRYYQIPSQQEQVSEQLKELEKKCKDGTWTVAQCLGYHPPQHWWQNSSAYLSPQGQQLAMARDLLKGSKSRELGRVEFRLGDVMPR